MAAERFDLAVQIHGGGRHSNPFVHRLGARLTAGLRTLEVVALVGATPIGLEPRVTVIPDDAAEAERVLGAADGPLVALQPGASDPRRRWPVERFAAVADALAGAGARVVVHGTPAEAHLTRAVVAAARTRPEDLCGPLSLGGLAALLGRCRVLVSNDTGPLHLAAAVGTATVGVYWCGNLVTAGPLTRARHRPAVSWRLACPACGADCTRAAEACRHPVSFVADVPVEEVVASALDLLAMP